MRRIADTAEKYRAKAIKITGAARIAITGLKEKDIDAAWNTLSLDKGAAVGLCVRSLRTCPGNTYCKVGQQDAQEIIGRINTYADEITGDVGSAG